MRRPVTLTILLLVLLAGSASADFTFVWISDPHIGHGPAVKAAEQWTAEIATLDPPPAFVVFTGDLTEFGSASDYRTLRRLTDGLPFPVRAVPGNHDGKWAPLSRYETFLGPLCWGLDCEGVHIVGLNSSVQLRGEGAIGLEQLAWLTEDLRTLEPGTPIIVLLHHPVGDLTSLDDEQGLLDALGGHNVALILSGHVHNESVRDVNGMRCVTGEDPWGEDASWYLVAVGEDRAVIRRKSVADAGYTEFAATDLRLRERPRLVIASPEAAATAAGDLAIRARLVGEDEEPESAEFHVDREGWASLTLAGDQMRAAMTAPDLRALVPGQHRVRLRATLAGERIVLGGVSFATPSDRLLWRTRVGEVRARPTLVPGARADDPTYLVVGTASGNLVCLDPESGEVRAACRLPGGVYGEAALVGAAAIFGCADGRLYGFQPGTGRMSQVLEASGPVFSGITADQGLVYFGTADGAIYCADVAGRELVWRTAAGDMVEAKPLVHEGRLYVADWAGTVHCLNASTGDVVWQQRVGSNRYYSPAASTPVALGDALYLVSPDQHLYCLDLATGALRWRKKTMAYDSIAGSRAGHIIIRGLDSFLYVFDADGTVAGRYEAGWGWDHAAIAPVVADGRVYCASKRGVVSAFAEATGEVVWRHKVSNLHVFSPVLVTEDAVYVGSTDGFLTALRR